MIGKASRGNVAADKINTIIGEGTVIDGSCNFSEATRIDGVINGEVKSKNKLIIGESGKIVGNVYAEELILGGSIEGNILGGDRVEILGTGTLTGDMQTRKLIIDENARFDGKCSMINSPEPTYLPGE